MPRDLRMLWVCFCSSLFPFAQVAPGPSKDRSLPPNCSLTISSFFFHLECPLRLSIAAITSKNWWYVAGVATYPRVPVAKRRPIRTPLTTKKTKRSSIIIWLFSGTGIQSNIGRLKNNFEHSTCQRDVRILNFVYQDSKVYLPGN